MWNSRRNSWRYSGHSVGYLQLERRINQWIPFLPRTSPMCIWPFRYPNFQKQELELLVTEMLKQRIVQPSHSLYSSSVLLVKKKKRWVLEILCWLSGTQQTNCEGQISDSSHRRIIRWAGQSQIFYKAGFVVRLSLNSNESVRRWENCLLDSPQALWISRSVLWPF